jgi:hypothetical protein
MVHVSKSTSGEVIVNSGIRSHTQVFLWIRSLYTELLYITKDDVNGFSSAQDICFITQSGKEREAEEKNKKVVVGKEIREERTKEREERTYRQLGDMEKGGAVKGTVPRDF